MNYEKKYKEALERMKSWARGEHPECFSEAQKAAEFVFPEIGKSEDEKIRRCISDVVRKYGVEFATGTITKEKMLAWLEKQGVQKPDLPKWKYKKDHTPLSRDSILLDQYGCVVKSQSGVIVSDVWVLDYDDLAKLPKEEPEKQGEQKTNDNVEPKFNVGDCIIRSAEGLKHSTYFVTEVKDYYVCEDLQGRRVTFTFNDVHKNFKFWDISDAEPGDVLSCDCYIFIYKGINPDDHSLAMSFCDCPKETDTYLTTRLLCNECDRICRVKDCQPATKEEKDQLFSVIGREPIRDRL